MVPLVHRLVLANKPSDVSNSLEQLYFSRSSQSSRTVPRSPWTSSNRTPRGGQNPFSPWRGKVVKSRSGHSASTIELRRSRKNWRPAHVSTSPIRKKSQSDPISSNEPIIMVAPTITEAREAFQPRISVPQLGQFSALRGYLLSHVRQITCLSLIEGW